MCENAARGGGPRHLAFSAGLDVCCLAGAVLRDSDPAAGHSGWTPVQTVDSCDKSHTYGAHLKISARMSTSCRTAGSSTPNRGRDLRLRRGPGRDLTPPGRFPRPTGGRRSFCVDPSGAYLLCANQDSDNVSIFRIRQEDGGLELTGAVEIPTPVNVVALPELD